MAPGRYSFVRLAVALLVVTLLLPASAPRRLAAQDGEQLLALCATELARSFTGAAQDEDITAPIKYADLLNVCAVLVAPGEAPDEFCVDVVARNALPPALVRDGQLDGGVYAVEACNALRAALARGAPSGPSVALGDNDRSWIDQEADGISGGLHYSGGLSREEAKNRRGQIVDCLTMLLASGVSRDDAGKICHGQAWRSAGLQTWGEAAGAPVQTNPAAVPPQQAGNPPPQLAAFSMKGRTTQTFKWGCFLEGAIPGNGTVDLTLEPDPRQPRYYWVAGAVDGSGQGSAPGVGCPGRARTVLVAYSYADELPAQLSFVDMNSDDFQFRVAVHVSYSETFQRCDDGPCPGVSRSQDYVGCCDFKGTWDAAKRTVSGTFGNAYLRGTWSAER